MSTEHQLRVGQEHDATAVRLNDDGDGVASVGGVTVFVPQLLPGERAKVVLTSVERRFARARVVHRETSAEGREAPFCGVFGQCGGCQLQHASYSVQLAHKREIVVQAMRRLAKLPDIEVLPTLGMQHPWRYRNQVQVPLSYDAETGRVVQGFFAAGSHDLVETRACHLEPVEMEATIERVTHVLEDVLGKQAVGVHHLVVRQSLTTGEQMVILCVRSQRLPLQTAVAAIVKLPHVVSVVRTVQPREHGPVWGPTTELLHGVPQLQEQIAPLEFLISPRSFFQVNTEQARVLYRRVLEAAAVTKDDVVLDAYCGTGTLSLLLATKAKAVLGIESVSAAVEDARLNATHNRLANAEFVVGEVERVLPKRVREGERFDVVVVDPPRKGCHPDVLAALVAARPKRIVYVSCNHVTLARDLRVLADAGYEVGQVQPVDMFPQTAHVECVVSAYRKD